MTNKGKNMGILKYLNGVKQNPEIFKFLKQYLSHNYGLCLIESLNFIQLGSTIHN